LNKLLVQGEKVDTRLKSSRNRKIFNSARAI